jgi:hypothetical protein
LKNKVKTNAFAEMMSIVSSYKSEFELMTTYNNDEVDKIWKEVGGAVIEVACPVRSSKTRK